MPWVVDPELASRRRRVLELLALARNVTSTMEDACSDLYQNTQDLVAGVQLGDKAASSVKLSIGAIHGATAACDSAREAARQIQITRWEPE